MKKTLEIIHIVFILMIPGSIILFIYSCMGHILWLSILSIIIFIISTIISTGLSMSLNDDYRTEV